uniref:Uncharacterized protein n=1 Tax=Moschus moschiferus TaxID=68415 RepID=A0A8C6FW13_MOSMO
AQGDYRFLKIRHFFCNLDNHTMPPATGFSIHNFIIHHEKRKTFPGLQMFS